ncbi:hypothetical protein Sgri01_07158 [Streptomyces griseus]
MAVPGRLVRVVRGVRGVRGVSGAGVEGESATSVVVRILHQDLYLDRALVRDYQR